MDTTTPRFCLTIPLTVPAIFNPLMTLDAVLAAALYARDGTTDSFESRLPVRFTNGCAHASTIQLGRGLFTAAPYTASLKGGDLNPDNYTDRTTRGRAVLQLRGGPFMSKIDAHRAWIGDVRFFAEGDSSKVLELLDVLPGLGAKTNSGWGRFRVDDVRVEDTEWNGLVLDSDGSAQPMRPIPLPLWSALGHQVDGLTAVDHVRWAPPYWRADRELCVLPRVIS